MSHAEMSPRSYLYFLMGDLRSMPAYVFGEDFAIAGAKCIKLL